MESNGLYFAEQISVYLNFTHFMFNSKDLEFSLGWL